ncbi:YdcF family protein [Limosilactobacillus gastricus]|uniref:Putative membrane protein n=1 Tax=Limosilactobacillus gastricus DSM 16045 TaxID=1423749 RepID=A0A0R1VB60_9LACO|nr:YdcF family protein [Limosilactobacillus gastricus]KRM02453.1 putative membrane protein [Limosilactobacillus gastricus DSM 16045]QGF40049.1 YdcF family protein [Limosilactobacillus gastricus]
MKIILLIITLLSCSAFGTIWLHDRRSLFLGFYFLTTLGMLGVDLLVVNIQLWQAGSQLAWLVLVVIVLIAILLLLVPFLTSFLLIINGIQLIRRTRRSFNNLLSLLAGCLLLINLTIWVQLDHLFASWGPFFWHLYHMVDLVIADVLFLLTIYTVTSLLNLIHFKHEPLDYLIVLGAGLYQGRVSPLLAGRVQKAVSLSQDNPQTKFIMSGGQGSDEPRSEAAAMKEYAMSLGVPADRIILEDQSTNTAENIKFSQRLIPPNQKIALVTNNFHLLRALLLSRQAGLPCAGYGSKSRFYYSLNAFIREFAGYLLLRKKLLVVILILIEGAYLLFATLTS